MSDYSSGGSGVGTVLKWMMIMVLAVVAIKVGLALAGMVLGLGFFVLFTIGPILLVGYIVLRIVKHFTDRTETPVL